MTPEQEELLREVLEELRWLRKRLEWPPLPPERRWLMSAQRERLIDSRKRLGYNQTQWGELLRRQQNVVSAWESGKTAVPVDVIDEWARLAGVTVAWIMGEETS